MTNLVSHGIVSDMTTDAASTQLRRGVIGPCILAVLASGPRYGLELVAELNQIGQLLTSQGTVYPLLNRLHEAGLVTSYWELGETDRPRRYYRITDSGTQELTTFRTDWRRFADSVDQLLETIPREQNA